MRVLIDTHVLAWWLWDGAKLSERVRGLLQNGASEIFVSAASAWEVATKVRLKKWPEAETLAATFHQTLQAEEFVVLPITTHHGLRAGSYDASHKDPFDRILAAQSEIDDLLLATNDSAFTAFNVKTMW